jgi:fructose-1-phosphate kinase PfkB-like protein
MAKILVAGLNPAWQQVLVAPTLHVGGVTRAAASHAVAGGKGMNAAKILARAGHEVSLLQVLAGTNGDRLLDACTALGILSLHVFSEGETRAAVTLVHDKTTTEIIEPFRAAGEDLEEGLLESVAADERYDALLVCGTLPGGLDPSFYEKLVRRVSCGLILWDSVMGFSEEVARRIHWLKVNAEEHRALAPLLEKYGAEPAVLVTDGPGQVRVRGRAGAGTYQLPALAGLVSPIGAGDTVAAVLADGLVRWNVPVEAAVKRALACGMASCLSPLPAEWKPWDEDRLEKEIHWTRDG